MTEDILEMIGSEVALRASRNKADGRGVFPRVPDTSPAKPLYEDTTLTGVGVLYSYTVMHPSPKTGKPPFVIGLVDYDGHTRVLGRIACDPAAVKIGMSVKATASSSEGDPAYFFEPSTEIWP